MMVESLPNPASSPPGERDEQQRRQRARNRAVLLILLGLVALIYAISIVRMGGG